jgi:hypothetical protein
MGSVGPVTTLAGQSLPQLFHSAGAHVALRNSIFHVLVPQSVQKKALLGNLRTRGPNVKAEHTRVMATHFLGSWELLRGTHNTIHW